MSSFMDNIYESLGSVLLSNMDPENQAKRETAAKLIDTHVKAAEDARIQSRSEQILKLYTAANEADFDQNTALGRKALAAIEAQLSKLSE